MTPTDNLIPVAMSIKTFAKMFEFDESTVRKMIRSGEIGCLKRPTDSVRILRTHVDEWIRKCDSSKFPDAENGTSNGEKTEKPMSDLQVARIVAMGHGFSGS